MRQRDKVYAAKLASMVIGALWASTIFLVVIVSFTYGG